MVYFRVIFLVFSIFKLYRIVIGGEDIALLTFTQQSSVPTYSAIKHASHISAKKKWRIMECQKNTLRG